MGIKLVSEPETISKNANCVVCKYIDKPLLINRSLFPSVVGLFCAIIGVF